MVLDVTVLDPQLLRVGSAWKCGPIYGLACLRSHMCPLWTHQIQHRACALLAVVPETMYLPTTWCCLYDVGLWSCNVAGGASSSGVAWGLVKWVSWKWSPVAYGLTLLRCRCVRITTDPISSWNEQSLGILFLSGQSYLSRTVWVLTMNMRLDSRSEVGQLLVRIQMRRPVAWLVASDWSIVTHKHWQREIWCRRMLSVG